MLWVRVTPLDGELAVGSHWVAMKHLLLTTIAAVVLVGCGKPNIWEAATTGNIEAAKQHLAKGVDVDAKDENG